MRAAGYWPPTPNGRYAYWHGVRPQAWQGQLNPHPQPTWIVRRVAIPDPHGHAGSRLAPGPLLVVKTRFAPLKPAQRLFTDM